jgi:UDP-N-acetylglucosamine--N-acetylmuramyl-(pentapeptide) pyrophosphoryl-undecaprenol N-acetylglucosamine transferase
MRNRALKIIISGGGTGGHIYPAVAVAQEIQRRYPDADILFVGASDRMEMEKVPKAGFKIVGLWISGIQRSLSYRNLLWPLKVIVSVLKSLRILVQFKPDACIGFGGYASGALLFAATLKKIPTLIHEQNSYAGITNKLLRKRVNRICVAYDGMERFFPSDKLVHTGNPVRKDVVNCSHVRDEAFKHFKLDAAKKTILIIGGSLGARTINESISRSLEAYSKAGVQLIWQTGKTYFTTAKKSESASVRVYDFIYEMNLAYAAADMVISRAGALSIAELALVKKPVILVPSPNVAEDHQTKNAQALVSKQAALMVADKDAHAQLADTALNLLRDTALQQQLALTISSFAISDAAERITDVLENILTKKAP